MIDVIYYTGLPIILSIALLSIWNEAKRFKFITVLTRKDPSQKFFDQKEALDNIKTYTLVFVIVLILYLPIWSHSASMVSEDHMHHELNYMSGPMGTTFAVRDPVIRSLGPSYDTDKILEQMREEPDRWMPDKVSDHVDLNSLTNIPGRLAVYVLREGRYIITYTYISPYPIIKGYGFTYEGDQMELVSERTFIYPSYPGSTSVLADEEEI